MKSLINFLSTLILLTITKSDDNSTLNCTLGWNVQWVGSSGQFKLFPCDNEKFFLKVNLQHLQAYNQDGTKQPTNKITTFSFASSVDASYNSGDSSVYSYTDDEGNNIALGGVQLRYEFELNNEQIFFNMTLFLLANDVIVNINGTEYQIQQGSLKFDFDIINWPFEAKNDSLQLGIKFTTGGTSKSATSDESIANGQTNFRWGDSFIVENPQTYEKITSNGNSAENVDISDISNSNEVTYLFKLAGDATEIHYDPWVSGDNSDAIQINFSKYILLFIGIFSILLSC